MATKLPAHTEKSLDAASEKVTIAEKLFTKQRENKVPQDWEDQPREDDEAFELDLRRSNGLMAPRKFSSGSSSKSNSKSYTPTRGRTKQRQRGGDFEADQEACALEQGLAAHRGGRGKPTWNGRG